MKKFIENSLYIIFLTSFCTLPIWLKWDLWGLLFNLIVFLISCCLSYFLVCRYSFRLRRENFDIITYLPLAGYGLITWIIALIVLFW